MWTIGLADQSMPIKCVLYHEDYLSKFVLGHCLLISNAIVKSDPESMVITKESVVRRSGGLSLTEEQRRVALLIACPLPAPEVPLNKVGTSPVKTMMTVVGRVVAEEVTRTVQVRGRDVNLKTVELQDRTAKCKVTLWRDHAGSNTTIGSYLRVSEVVVQSYKDEKSLSTTYKTKVTTVECPQETKEMKLIAFEREEMQYSLTFEDEDNFPSFSVNVNCLENVFECAEEEVEDALAQRVPLDVRVTSLRGQITDMTIL